MRPRKNINTTIAFKRENDYLYIHIKRILRLGGATPVYHTEHSKTEGNMFNISEKDWRLFKERMPDWQERYMAQLNEEYIKLLSADLFPNCPIRINLSWCIAEAVGAVKRHLQSWSSWVTRISWSSAGSLIGRARSKNNVAVQIFSR